MVLTTIETQNRVLETMGKHHIRVAVAGNVDAGKSTLIGTLRTSTLDDGRGLNRGKIMKHKHERDTGRTSTISQHEIGFDMLGDVLSSCASESEIAKTSARVVSLMDVAGHEKHFRTTVAGLSMGMADYSLVLVNSAQPPTIMTMHHLRLCAACGVPVIIVMTKADSCPSHVFRQTKNAVVDTLRSPEFNKRYYEVKSDRDVETVKDKLHSLVPAVTVSCVTGEGLDVLKKMLFALPKRRHHEKKMNRPFEFLIEEVFNVKGIGHVLSGFVFSGTYRKGEPLFIGPMKDGTYAKATVRSIHVAQTDVDYTYAGHSACLAISMAKTQRFALTRRGMGHLKGMVALREVPNPPAIRNFKADLVMLRGEPVTVTKGQFNATAHILHLKQSVKVMDFSHSNPARAGNLKHGRVSTDTALVMRPGDQARVTFQTVGGAVYIRKGMRILLRDGHVRAVGVIVETGG
jgi:elongation factor 1-alpha